MSHTEKLSDTPKTDRVVGGCALYWNDAVRLEDVTKFARQLECELSQAIERERLANMRADQAEEARDAARSATAQWRHVPDVHERQVAWIDVDARHVAVVVKGREYILTLPPRPIDGSRAGEERNG